MIVRKLKNINTFVTGRAHIKKGTPCQDRTKYVVQDHTHVISLCDGAGSRTYSQYGAEITTQAACDYFSKNFEHYYMVLSNPLSSEDDQKALKEEFLTYLNKKIDDYVNAHPPITQNDLLCTLEFVAIRGNRYIAGHCGDGVIGILTDSRRLEMLEVLSAPDNGEASNITYFINDKGGSNHLRFYSGTMLGVEGFILMSDGPEEALFHKTKGLNPNTSIFFRALRNGITKDSKEMFDKILSEKIAEISYDDLSVNVLAYVDVDLDKGMSEEESNDFFNGIYESQVVVESGYYVTIDLCRNGEGRLLTGYQAIDLINRLKEWCA